jgi:hypothetical protein
MNVKHGVVLSMDNGHVMRFFFKNIPNKWPIWADGPKILGVFVVFPVVLLVQSHYECLVETMFLNNQALFLLKKLKECLLFI